MPTTTTATAPELTAEQVQRILVTPLAAASVFLASGVRIFDVTHSGRVRIPRLTGMTSPGWHGEGEQITEVSPDFDDVILLDGVASLKAIVRYSNEMAAAASSPSTARCGTSWSLTSRRSSTRRSSLATAPSRPTACAPRSGS